MEGLKDNATKHIKCDAMAIINRFPLFDLETLHA